MNESVWIGIYVLIGIYIAYKLFFKKNKFDARKNPVRANTFIRVMSPRMRIIPKAASIAPADRVKNVSL